MTDRPFSSTLGLLRAAVHGVLVTLLVVGVVRSLAREDAPAPAVLTIAALFAATYAVGVVSERRLHTPRRGRVWLLAVTAAWVGLVLTSPDFAWVAFPLFFLHLHVLPLRSAMPAVVALTVAVIAAIGWHEGRLAVGSVLGPIIGASIAVLMATAYRALYRESARRQQLIDDLVRTRDELAVAQRKAGASAERERLAREIHDTLAQGLSSIVLLLHAAERADDRGTALGHVRRARKAAEENLAEARRFVHALTPPALVGGSLSEALERLCHTTAERIGAPIRWHVDGEPSPLPTEHEVTLLRIAQGALGNVALHARAGSVGVTLSYLDDMVALDVVDDGIGFDPENLSLRNGEGGGFGLRAMRGRVDALGGTLTLESAPGDGTAVAVTLPVPGEPS
ncbi:two-component sensor histidine kinase [Longimycelium tulufanense]|uniref:Oxygen sensor histidine kinase NreB n=1 Tax=Longimycelium tulufanense TaxID=907463 RepID=A0A8J3C8X1_9PSEU|nr:sensor histidine kinase [Longimycelium tulufanense]GGM56910.1 two-component sensor histidine kinase [Longimycelium tulufanense]